MIILGDSTITDATITATNTLSYAPEEKLQIYQLVDKFKASQGVTKIVLDYGVDTSAINAVGLCGTNISDSATVSLSYSDVDADTYEDTITLTDWSSFNQVFLLDASYTKRYWIIDINDPDPQGDDSDGVEIGYIYPCESINVDMVTFPHVPTLNIVSIPSTSATGQEYGSKGLNQNTLEFTATFNESELVEMLNVIKSKQNIDPVVIIPLENRISSDLYPPRYGVLSADSYAYPMVNSPGNYELTLSHRETF